MVATLGDISKKIVESYTISLGENERINKILDHINETKKEYSLLSNALQQLSELLRQITWLDNLTESDEAIIKGILTIGKEADKIFRKFHITQTKIYEPKGWLKKELNDLKSEIELHFETLRDIEHIIFELRKNSDFQDLCNLIDDASNNKPVF